MRRLPLAAIAPAAAALLLLIGGCGGDNGVAAAVAGDCASAGGTLLGCDHPVNSPEDACDKLLECGAIPLTHDENWVFDWGRCVQVVSALPPERLDLALACIEATSCDLLVADGDDGDDGNYLCLDYGDR